MIQENKILEIANKCNGIVTTKQVMENNIARIYLTKLIKEKCKVIISEKLDYKMLGDYITNMFKEANKKILISIKLPLSEKEIIIKNINKKIEIFESKEHVFVNLVNI